MDLLISRHDFPQPDQHLARLPIGPRKIRDGTNRFFRKRASIIPVEQIGGISNLLLESNAGFAWGCSRSGCCHCRGGHLQSGANTINHTRLLDGSG